MKKVKLLIALLAAFCWIASGCQGTAQWAQPTDTPTPGKAKTYANPATVTAQGQTVTTQFSARGYAPITVQVGVPVTWTISMAKGDLNGCNNAIQIPALDIEQQLAIGDTVVTFTPTAVGSIPYSCWMGMIRSTILVVDDLPVSESVENRPEAMAAVPVAVQGPSRPVITAKPRSVPSCCCGE